MGVVGRGRAWCVEGDRDVSRSLVGMSSWGGSHADRGSLNGCWYTNIEKTKDNGAPSGVYIESGEEVFVGSLNGGLEGTFATTYQFESKWDPDVSTGSEVHGRCQHPIAAGSGTGGFEGASGRADFKDEVTTGRFFYRGHIKLG